MAALAPGELKVDRRIVVLTNGPLPTEAARLHSAAGGRAGQFVSAIGRDLGAASLLRLALDPPAGPRTDAASTLSPAEADDPAALRRRLDALAPTALVGASTYASFLLARSGHPAPLWVDLHGDPMAEGQAVAAATGDDAAVAEHGWLLSWCLRRGDRFSAVSAPQRLAVLGQLGVAGRLNRHTAGESLVEVIRESVEPLAAPSPVGDDGPFTLLFSGSFNSWIDGELLLAGLERLLAGDPSIRFVATGGEIPGFLEAPWRRFVAGVERWPESLRDRVELRGWVASEELATIEAAASCGLIPERRLVERELGSHNRSLGWLARGIPIVATELSEIGRDLAAAGGLSSYRPGDVESFVAAVRALAADRALARAVGERGRAWLARERSLAVTAAPLVAWLRDPRPAGDRAAGAVTALSRRQAEIVRDQLTLEERLEAGRRQDDRVRPA